MQYILLYQYMYYTYIYIFIFTSTIIIYQLYVSILHPHLYPSSHPNRCISSSSNSASMARLARCTSATWKPKRRRRSNSLEGDNALQEPGVVWCYKPLPNWENRMNHSNWIYWLYMGYMMCIYNTYIYICIFMHMYVYIYIICMQI